MFDAVQKNKRLLQVVLAIIIIPFAFFGLESYTRSIRGGDDVASVDGMAISQQEFGETLRQQQERLRAVLGKGFDAGALDTPETRQGLLDSLVSQRLVSSAAFKGNLAVSDDSLREAILAIPAFQRDGRFDDAIYRQLLRAQGMNEQAFEARMRHDMTVGQLTRAISETAIASRAAAERHAELEGQRREIAEVLIPLAPFLARVRIDEARLKSHYESNLSQFRTPERIRAEYVVLSAEDLGRQEAVSEEELQKAYEARAAQYKVEEQRRASHILVKTKEEAERVAAEAHKLPARFAELAKKHSQDSGSADKGGDLGSFGRGMMVKAFEDAVFRMKEGEIAGPVESEFGWHVIRLTGVQAERARALDDVRKELAAELSKQKGAKKFAEAAEIFGNTVYEQSDSLKPAAERLKLQIRATDWIERGAAPAPLDHPKAQAALFSQDALQARRNTDAIDVAPSVLVAARVAEHRPAAQRKFEEVRGEIEALLRRQEAARLAREEGAAKLAELAKGDDAGLKWSAPRTVAVSDRQGLPPEPLRKVFAADPQKLPAHFGVERDDGYALVRVVRALAPEARGEQRKAADLIGAQRRAGADQFEAWVAALRARATIEVNRANLDKK